MPKTADSPRRHEEHKVRKLGPLLRVLCAFVVSSAPASAAGVIVADGWFRALPSGLPAGGYFELHNDSGHRLTLSGAKSPACGMLMLHRSMNMNGMSSMAEVRSIAVAVGQTLSFAPGGYHLMCMQPTSAMEVGEHVPVTLTFEDGSSVTAQFSVRGATGK